MSIAAFIKDLTARGIELYPNGEQLGCRAPEDYLTPAFVDQLKTQKQALLAYLSDSTVCELAYTQKGLWYEYQLVPERTDYNISHLARIYSAVDVALLRQAFQRLVNRHPALRATICEIDGAPQQQFHHYQAVAFTQIDASGCSWDEVQTLVQRYHQQRFDLSERAFRVFLFTKAPDEHVLLISMHHLFMDGWSIRILYAELEELYRATKQQRIATLPVLEATYADYVAWQQAMLDAQGEELYGYWSQQLAGELPVLDLPTDRPHAPSYTLKTAKEHFALPTALRSALQDLARQEGVTLATLLLALYQLLLHRYSGQNDIIVGSIMPGRNQAEFETLLGCFLTPLAIRTQVDATLSFQRFLHQFNQNMLAGLNHQEYPFALLVEKIKPTRLTGRSPLFQAAFNMQRTQHDLIHTGNGRTLEAMEAAWDWDGLRLSAITGIEDDAPLDLTLHVVDSGDRIQCVLSYHPELFDSTTIQRMATHFQSLLAGVVANPQSTIAALPLLTQAEQHQLLVEWNNTATAYPKDKCIHHMFEEQAARTPDAVAVVMAKDKVINANDVTLSPFDILRAGSCHLVTLTYVELNERANQLAHHLRSLGVGSLPGAETLVGICIERSVEMVVGLLAILKAGGAYVPLDPNYPQERLTFMLQDAQPAVVLTQSHLCERLPIASAQLVICDADGGQFAHQCHENPAPGLQGGQSGLCDLHLRFNGPAQRGAGGTSGAGQRSHGTSATVWSHLGRSRLTVRLAQF